MSARSIASSMVVYHGFVGGRDRAVIAERAALKRGQHDKAAMWSEVKATIEDQMAACGAFDQSPMMAAGMSPIVYPAQHVSRGVI